MKSIKWKLVAIYLVIVFIVMIVSGTFIIMRIKNVEIESGRKQLVKSAEKIRDEIIYKYDETDFQNQLEIQYSSQSGVDSTIQVNILNSAGTTVATSTTLSEPYPTYKNSDVIKALAGMDSFSYGRKDIDVKGAHKKWMDYSLPISEKSHVKYVVFVCMDVSVMQQSLDQTTEIIVVAMLIALSLGGIIGYIFSSTITGPIRELTKGARLLAEGNLSKTIKVGSNDEIGELTENFNNMATELSKTMSTISSEKNKLQTVLHNMTDGVLAYNSVGYLIHANPASSEMLELAEMPSDIKTLLDKFGIESDLEKFLKMEEDTTFEHILEIGKKHIKTNAVPYYSKDSKAEGIIVVLQDITKQKKLDDMRKEFVANVSHELRTPLTTIKSYSETLVDGAIEQADIAREFLQIIDSEADRMALLVSDLLQLSRFDSNQLELNCNFVMLDGFLLNCFNQHRILAEKKDQKYTYIPMEEDVKINMDVDRISQVFSNVIGNAIKYSPEGSTITLSTTLEENYIKVCIKDNGLGIPKEDLPRIFERFYRVDKARSRAMGGTGLGLAISKEIMMLQGGMINVESEYGEGTTMILWLPKL